MKIKTYVPYSILISKTCIANIVKWIELGQTWNVNSKLIIIIIIK
jgi:hypothetical protein